MSKPGFGPTDHSGFSEKELKQMRKKFKKDSKKRLAKIPNFFFIKLRDDEYNRQYPLPTSEYKIGQLFCVLGQAQSSNHYISFNISTGKINSGYIELERFDFVEDGSI